MKTNSNKEYSDQIKIIADGHIKVLKQFAAWRKSETIKAPDPVKLNKALDWAISNLGK
jgi:hypothetical protein